MPDRGAIPGVQYGNLPHPKIMTIAPRPFGRSNALGAAPSPAAPRVATLASDRHIAPRRDVGRRTPPSRMECHVGVLSGVQSRRSEKTSAPSPVLEYMRQFVDPARGLTCFPATWSVTPSQKDDHDCYGNFVDARIERSRPQRLIHRVRARKLNFARSMSERSKGMPVCPTSGRAGFGTS